MPFPVGGPSQSAGRENRELGFRAIADGRQATWQTYREASGRQLFVVDKLRLAARDLRGRAGSSVHLQLAQRPLGQPAGQRAGGRTERGGKWPASC